MRNKYLGLSFLFFWVSTIVPVGCVNPPERRSGSLPPPGPEKKESPAAPGRKDDPVVPPGSADGASGGTTPPVVAPEVVKVSYWLNRTDNNNCLLIQPTDSDAISSKCVAEGALTGQWVSKELTTKGDGPFKVRIQVDTTEKISQKYFSTQSDNLAEQEWRWRCVKTQDKVTKKFVTTVCYEDGNAITKNFDSSDLFVQIVGPENVDVGSISCVVGVEVDMPKCQSKQ